jgi:heme oxygenase
MNVEMVQDCPLCAREVKLREGLDVCYSCKDRYERMNNFLKQTNIEVTFKTLVNRFGFEYTNKFSSTFRDKPFPMEICH